MLLDFIPKVQEINFFDHGFQITICIKVCFNTYLWVKNFMSLFFYMTQFLLQKDIMTMHPLFSFSYVPRLLECSKGKNRVYNNEEKSLDIVQLYMYISTSTLRFLFQLNHFLLIWKYKPFEQVRV